MDLIERIVAVPGVEDVHLTTNGVLTRSFIKDFKRLGIASVNLSLDTLDRDRFKAITRRDEFENVMDTFHQLLAYQIPTKINAVVMEGKNIDDILPLVKLTRDHPVSVRFIEEMPFNGEGSHYPRLKWTHKKIIEFIKEHYPTLERQQDPAYSTAYHYRVGGYEGSIGVIAAFSRTFCGTCNRIRVTAQGTLKTCLYDDGVLDIKQLMRSGGSDEDLTKKLLQCLSQRHKDGFEAEQNRMQGAPVSESMSTIGG